jgi:hypothetical protein
MTVAELLLALQEHAADGRRAQDEVHVKVGREVREVSAGYSNGTFVLTAGNIVNGGRRDSR